MEKISHDVYKERLSKYVKEEREKSDRKPNGFYGNWAFHSLKEKEFKKKLEEQGIVVEG